jgi:hypothetical protein
MVQAYQKGHSSCVPLVLCKLGSFLAFSLFLVGVIGADSLALLFSVGHLLSDRGLRSAENGPSCCIRSVRV